MISRRIRRACATLPTFAVALLAPGCAEESVPTTLGQGGTGVEAEPTSGSSGAPANGSSGGTPATGSETLGGRASHGGNGGGQAVGDGGQGGVISSAVRGGFSMYVPAADACSIGERWLDLPSMGGQRAVTETAHEHLAADGDPVPFVNCQWDSLEAPTRSFLDITLTDGGVGRFVSMAPDVVVGTHEHAIRVDFGGDAPVLRTNEGQLCEFFLVELDVARRSLWGRVRCPVLTDDDGVEQCTDVEAYFYFEGCTQR